MPDPDVILDPLRIEAQSFAMIDSEAGDHGYDERQWPVVRRIIHTTADFDFAGTTIFAPGVIDRALAAIRRGAGVYCDTGMVRAGVSKPRLARFGCSLCCHVADEDVATAARKEGITRSIVAMRKGIAAGCSIFLIGNAPTALYELLDRAAAGDLAPALVVGVPVGFVGAAESKAALETSGLPFITCRGRKGGSAIAAASLNALMILAEENEQ